MVKWMAFSGCALRAAFACTTSYRSPAAVAQQPLVTALCCRGRRQKLLPRRDFERPKSSDVQMLCKESIHAVFPKAVSGAILSIIFLTFSIIFLLQCHFFHHFLQLSKALIAAGTPAGTAASLQSSVPKICRESCSASAICSASWG